MTPNHTVITALVTIVSVTQPVGRIARLGDVASALPDKDVADIVRLSACGSSAPWLLVGFTGQMTDVQHVEVFCSADEIDGALRRGQLSWIQRDKFSSGTWSPWSLRERHRYAQLVPAARSFEEILAEQDLNRPFRVSGELTDDELISLVKFIRSGPTWTGGTARQQVERKWPLTSLSRETDGTVVARLNKDYMEGQRVTVRRSADGWTIIRVSYWIV